MEWGATIRKVCLYASHIYTYVHTHRDIYIYTHTTQREIYIYIYISTCIYIYMGGLVSGGSSCMFIYQRKFN